jgi:GNAT superfamily N-acetyltransferase
MMDAAQYSVIEVDRGNVRVEIRALKPDDRAHLLEAMGRTTAQSLFRRFFSVKRTFSEREIDFFVNVDFVDHVALVAVADEAGRSAIVGGARYVVVSSGKAEVALAVIDAYQGRGIGTALLRHLIAIARRSGLRELTADVLCDNAPMLKAFKASGFRSSSQRDGNVLNVTLPLQTHLD